MALTEEMVGVTEARKDLPRRVNRLEAGEVSRVVLLRRSQPVAVILSTDEYERFRAMELLSEELEDLRAALRAWKDDDGTRVSLDEVLKMLD